MNREQIGAGYFKKVYVDPNNPEKALSQFRERQTNEQIKSAYYLNKIAHLLFPENIPNISVAGNTENSYFISERVVHDNNHAKGQSLRMKNEPYYMEGSETNMLNKKESDELENVTKTTGEDPRVKEFIQRALSSGIYIDEGGQNFSIDSKGIVHYFDLEPGWLYSMDDGTPKFTFDVTKLHMAIKALPPQTREIANLYLDRLMELTYSINKRDA